MADRISGLMLSTMLGTIAAHYLYQWLGDGLWSVALERSFFGGVAIAGAWVVITLSRIGDGGTNG